MNHDAIIIMIIIMIEVQEENYRQSPLHAAARLRDVNEVRAVGEPASGGPSLVVAVAVASACVCRGAQPVS